VENENGLLPPETAKFYRECIRTLHEAEIPFMIGGAYAFGVYTGVERHTKDLDFFLRPNDIERALERFRADNYIGEVTYPHWLAKVFCGEDCLDLIFRAGNGLCEVDDSWFERAPRHDVLGMNALLTAPEEMLWMKAYIMERERFDGADVAHLIHSYADNMDWEHLLRRFDAHWRVLLGHLVLFGFIYPSDRDRIPAEVMRDLLDRARAELHEAAPNERVCRGTLLSRAQYLPDVLRNGFSDARLGGESHMTAHDVETWTEAIEAKDRPQV
jgi:hypothetical protein